MSTPGIALTLVCVHRWWQTALVTFALKMCAIFLEQVAIGMNLGKLLAVRKLVQVNSIEIKAIKVILDTKGLNLKKVAILCGGPDWPTSVLTGGRALSILGSVHID
eukprot:COSAG01_NODE_4531_length_4948_cov_5.839905_9_plen_106_part_00